MSYAKRYSCALVTGASAGLGEEFVLQLAPRVDRFVLVARRQDRLDELSEKVRARFPNLVVEVIATDLTSVDGCKGLIETLSAKGLVADLLVNNAGFGTIGSLARVALASQEAMLKLHVLLPNALTHAVLPGMIARRSGAIINVSSVASYVTSAGNANYCGSKAYLRTFSEALAQEVSRHGIVVQALCPGFTHTEFHARAGMDKTRIPAVFWLSAERVVSESLAALVKGRPVAVIPGKRYRAIVALLRHAPDWMRVRGARRYRRDVEGAPPSA